MIVGDGDQSDSQTQTEAVSPTNPPLSTPNSDILSSLHTAPDGHYAATPGLPTQASFFIGGSDGDTLIFKDVHPPKEFILRGLFEIARNDFFLTPDGNWNPNNIFNNPLADVKPSCFLNPYRSPDYPFSLADFPSIISNIRDLERLAIGAKAESGLMTVISSVHDDRIKIVHRLFEPKKVENDWEDGDSQTIGSSHSVSSLGDEYRLENWPVAERAKESLLKLADTHDVDPLAVYDATTGSDDHILVPPSKYKEKLRGAAVEAHLALVHHFISRYNRHVFNLHIRLLIIRHRPLPSLVSPFKLNKKRQPPAILSSPSKRRATGA